ncbi:MAG: TetR/AcrR family transcriptional regulator [Myxococcota bacterium]|nr:TetR/AcrR family transcriptional regulator [Myxococcota bacterium]
MKEATTSEPDTATRREAKKAAQRQRILDAAREVYFRDGFMEANLDEVAQIAGVAKGTLYRYFESKADLYLAVLSHNGQVFEERMRAAAESAPGAPEQLRAVGRFYHSHWSQHPEYFEIFWAVDNQELIGGLPSEVVDEVSRLWTSCLRILEDVIRRGVEQGSFHTKDPWAVANIVWTVANGLIRTEQVDARRKIRGGDLERAFEEMTQFVLLGLTNPDGDG